MKSAERYIFYLPDSKPTKLVPVDSTNSHLTKSRNNRCSFQNYNKVVATFLSFPMNRSQVITLLEKPLLTMQNDPSLQLDEAIKKGYNMWISYAANSCQNSVQHITS